MEAVSFLPRSADGHIFQMDILIPEAADFPLTQTGSDSKK